MGQETYGKIVSVRQDGATSHMDQDTKRSKEAQLSGRQEEPNPARAIARRNTKNPSCFDPKTQTWENYNITSSRVMRLCIGSVKSRRLERRWKYFREKIGLELLGIRKKQTNWDLGKRKNMAINGDVALCEPIEKRRVTASP